jgi:acetyl esterase/lipase
MLLAACVAPTAPSESVALVDTPAIAPPVDTPTSVPPTVQPYEVVRDISYQEDVSDYAQERGKLDIYLPKDRENFPVLVWFHGGALTGGDKRAFYVTSVAKRFASEGIGVVLPMYRLSPQVQYPTYIEDAASAVSWAYHNIGTYGGNREQLFVGGHSSGAYLAAMVGMDERYLEKYQISPRQIAGVIPLSGEMYGDTTVWAERGIYKVIDDSKVTVDETTPMFYVRQDAPPFLCMCAENDEQPPEACEENQEFIEALQAAGHDNAIFKQIPDRDHFSISGMRSPDDPVVALMLAFMQEAISGE